MKLKAEVLFADLDKPDPYGWYSVKVKLKEDDDQGKALLDEARNLLVKSNHFAHEKLADQWFNMQLTNRPNKLPFSRGDLDVILDQETGDMRVRSGLEGTLVLKAKSKYEKTKVARGDIIELDVKLRVYDLAAEKAFGMSAYINDIVKLEEAKDDEEF